MSLHFFVRRTEENAPVHALLTDLLTASSADYPSLTALTLRLESLYAADISAKLSLCGDAAVLSFTASWLDDRYALHGEALTEAVADTFFGCLLRPNVQQGAFTDPLFRICRQNLLDDIECAANDRHAYALRCAAALAYQGEPAAIPATGSRAAAEAVTAQTAYAVWQKILQTAPAACILVTPEPKPVLQKKLTDAFVPLRGTIQPAPLFCPSPKRSAPVEKTETLPVGQTKLVLTYKFDGIPREVLAVLCAVLCWNSDSLLFVSLRERQPLCYYCSLTAAYDKQTLMIDSGTDHADLPKVRRIVAQQITALQNGAFTEEMMQQAVLRYECRAAAVSDSPFDTAAALLDRILRDDPRSMQEMAAAMRQVTKAQVAEAARRLVPDSVFVLRAEREEAAAE